VDSGQHHLISIHLYDSQFAYLTVIARWGRLDATMNGMEDGSLAIRADLGVVTVLGIIASRDELITNQAVS
jgi:hypothetical protein